MIVFDLYVGNNDRRRNNIVLRQDGRLALIDHGNSLLYYRSSDSSVPFGIERLEKLKRDLRVMFDKPHYFLRALTEMRYLESWMERIRQIPDYFLESLIQNMPALDNIDEEVKEKTAAFLLDRRTQLFDQIMTNRDLFPNLLEEGRRDA